VFNGDASAFNGDRFIFAAEDGVISGWRGQLGTNAETLSASPDAIYKGLAIAMVGDKSYLYAADFHNNQIHVLPAAGAPDLSGSFTDPTLPSGYAPFNIQNLGGQLYVTYAQQDAAKHDDVPGPGKGFVDVFDTQGNFIKRLASGDPVNAPLNAPWGLAMVGDEPFGRLAKGTLLVGNFGDGTINAFNSDTGAFLGTLASLGGAPLMNNSLWGLRFGNGGTGGRATSLYLTAGLNDETNGLFARVDAVPEPGTVTLLGAGLAFLIVRRRVRA
jgi:uncharacterized protein (TIGR03118 family)